MFTKISNSPHQQQAREQVNVSVKTIKTNFNRNGEQDAIMAELNHVKKDAHANAKKIDMCK